MDSSGFPKLHFEYEYDERLADEANARGHLGGVTVELADGSRHPVFFFDPVRLAQELEEDAKLGRPFIAEKGMIVVKEITLQSMTAAVEWLARHGFFDPDVPAKDAE